MRSLGLVVAINVVAIALAGMIPAGSAHADVKSMTVETGCTTEPSFTAVVRMNSGTYDAYVRLGKRGQTGQVAGFAQPYGPNSMFGRCDPVGTATATGDAWTRLGTVSIQTPGETTVEIASRQFDGKLDANRPSVLLIPQENPVCIPIDECRLSVDGAEGYVRPAGSRLNQDSLKVAVVTTPDSRDVRQVRYYVDDELTYSSESLDDFDMRYVAFAGQKLTRVVEYGTGHQVVLAGVSSSTHADSFGNFVFRLSQRYPTAFIGIIMLLILILVVSLLIGLVRLHKRRQAWRMHHGFITNKSGMVDLVMYRITTWKGYKFVKYGFMTVILMTAVCSLVLAVTEWGAQVVMVDGRSMETTYSSGDQVLVNKLPKTFANINNGEYVPKRGDVVVVRANFGNVAIDSTDYEAPLIIKRVLALPGERVEVRDGILTIYNKEFPEGFVPDKGSAWEKSMTPDEPTESIDIRLDTTELFLSGDNRPESIDSRFNGPLLAKEVVGVVAMKF